MTPSEQWAAAWETCLFEDMYLPACLPACLLAWAAYHGKQIALCECTCYIEGQKVLLPSYNPHSFKQSGGGWGLRSKSGWQAAAGSGWGINLGAK